MPKHAKSQPLDSDLPSKKARVSASQIYAKPKTMKSKKTDITPTPAPAPTPKSKGKQKAQDPQLPTPLASTLKLVAGSYEKLLYGIDARPETTEDGTLKFELKPRFIFPAHVSCIKAVAASPKGGKWLATGSADEIIKVWDLKRRKEIGGLMHHEGSITHLVFPSRSHLLSASEDGTLCLFHARDWAVLRTLKGHKGRVNALAVHPSGKVALSVGKDRTLRMWDLMRGKGVASTKLGKEGEIVRWSHSGNVFAVQSGSTIDLYNTEMTLLHTIDHPSRLHDLKFCLRVVGEGELMLAAAEDKKVSVYQFSEDPEVVPRIIASLVGHSNRVKAVQTLQIATELSTGRSSTTVVATVSSDGKMHVYDLARVPEDSAEVAQIEPCGEYDSKGTRLTCITLAEGDAPSKEADKEQEEEEEIYGHDTSDDEE